MYITRKSLLTGKVRTRKLSITQEQYDAWVEGALIQDAFPHLSSSDREFIKSGMTGEEWDEAFKEEE